MKPVDLLNKVRNVMEKGLREPTGRRLERDHFRSSTTNLVNTRYGYPLFMVEKSNSQVVKDQMEITDPVRFLAGAYWTSNLYSLKGEVYLASKKPGSSFVNFIKDVDKSKESKAADGRIFFEEHFDFLIEDPVLAPHALDILEFGTKETIFDHCCVINTLTDQKGSNKNSQTPSIYAKIKPDYNYYQETYEPASSFLEENALPNFYAFYEAENVSENLELSNFLTLGGRLKPWSPNGVFYQQGQDGRKDQRISPVGQYFNSWSLHSQDWSDSEQYQSHISKFKNVIYSHKDISSFEAKNKNKQVFPMFVDIEFSTSKNSKATSALSETKIISELQQDIIKATQDDALPTIETLEAQSSPAINADLVWGDKTEVRFGKKRVYDFKKWIEEFQENRNDQINNYIEMNQGEDELRGEQYEFFYNLMGLIAKGKFNKIVEEEARNYSDLLDGKKCYNETIFYRVDKHVGTETDGDLNKQPIQSFYFTNLADAEKIAFVDSQVKYENSYTYKIYSFDFVVGSEYKINVPVASRTLINQASLSPQMGAVGTIRVVTTPTTMLIENEIFSKEVHVMDNPPVAPEVEIIPFRGVQDKIRVFLTSGVGSYDLHPISIEDEESVMLRKLRVSQDLEDDDKIRFESDDVASRFTVYRMDNKPNNYKDFNSGLIRSIDTGGFPSVALDDRINPNQKYYYCFKSVDIHGHYSYPSFVYEVELVSDAGSVYPLVRTVDFDKDRGKVPTKSLKRLIHLKPSILQTQVDNRESGLEDAATIPREKQVSLGAVSEKIWGKKFKIRLTSKSSGKKVDFNVSFDVEAEKQRR